MTKLPIFQVKGMYNNCASWLRYHRACGANVVTETVTIGSFFAPGGRCVTKGPVALAMVAKTVTTDHDYPF